MRTEKFPLAVELVSVDVYAVIHRREIDLATVVSPRTELHRAVLVVEREPRDVDGTRRDVKTERNPRTSPVRVDDDVRRKLAVDVFVGTIQYGHYSLTPSTPAVPNCCCSKGSAPYWSNPPFLTQW